MSHAHRDRRRARLELRDLARLLASPPCDACGRPDGRTLTALDRSRWAVDIAPWVRALCPACAARIVKARRS
jgi:hypothetical protein